LKIGFRSIKGLDRIDIGFGNKRKGKNKNFRTWTGFSKKRSKIGGGFEKNSKAGIAIKARFGTEPAIVVEDSEVEVGRKLDGRKRERAEKEEHSRRERTIEKDGNS
jgi:hypothetical protein